MLQSLDRTYEELKQRRENPASRGVCKCLDRTYEELKPCSVSENLMMASSRLDRTYEELKLTHSLCKRYWRKSLDRTYEELKPNLVINGSGGSLSPVWIVPMRN